MLYFVIFVGAIIAFITYSNKRAAEKEETLRRENAARSTARPEDVLTEGGIPKRTIPQNPSRAQMQSDFLKKPEQIHVTYRSPYENTTKTITGGQLPKTPVPQPAPSSNIVQKKELLPIEQTDDNKQIRNTAVSNEHRYSAYAALLDKRYEPEDNQEQLREERLRIISKHCAALEDALQQKPKELTPELATQPTTLPAENASEPTPLPLKPMSEKPKPQHRQQAITNPPVKPRDTLKDKSVWQYSPYRRLLRPRLNNGYKTLTAALLAEYDAEKCIICSKPTKGTPRQGLSNHLFVHAECYEIMSKQMSTYTRDEEIPSTGKEYERIRRFMIANCYWPTYPEDWEQRKAIILNAADYQCEECEDDGSMLCVHHKQWLSQGGSNALDNLQCLCWNCHEKAHGRPFAPNKTFTGGKNRPLIQQAINDGKDIEFNYVDVKGVRTRRPVTPLRFIKSPHDHPALSAMDHLDNSPVPYTFIIRKMTHLKIVERKNNKKGDLSI
ncbi:HNH endonuclease signature motif containing protein [Cloacibacillus porcorum]|uniref:HNH endonuclease n=1 Tax=Cloacibacillus porcorum TaxID=1197717 RepID=UPI00259109CB|nr:HNH endonuclease signature motif containing protein [Cloacibacillus porcorum]